MIKRFLLILFVLGVGLTHARATQIVEGPTSVKIGVGTSLTFGAGVATGSILLPIRVGQSLRLEAEFGAAYTESGQPLTTTWTFQPAFHIAFFLARGNTRPVVGFRIGYSETGTEVAGKSATACGPGTVLQGHTCVLDIDGDPSNNPTLTLPVRNVASGVVAGITFGAEHFFGETFSVGVEGRVTYKSAGGSGVVANGLALARLYFH